MDSFLRGARVFISLEKSGSGFGIPQVEAMSVGTPVVASFTGPTREVVGEGGLLTKYNSKEIAKAIYTCCTDQTLRGKLSQNGVARAKIYQPKKVALLLLQYVDKILRSR